jgi:hypothetical protein
LVALVLSLLTGYASAQFHLRHDDFFETVRDLNVIPTLVKDTQPVAKLVGFSLTSLSQADRIGWRVVKTSKK